LRSHKPKIAAPMMNATKRQGLFSLANVAEIQLGKVTAGNIGFMLGPRLNASGRLESALASLELLTTTDFMRAGQLAWLKYSNWHG
jgi:single-stranded-DNA-specific exonuclease